MPAGDLKAVMLALRAALAVAMPGRVVERGFIPMAERRDDELLAGVVCVVSLGEGDFANWRGREADLGVMDVALVAQIRVADDRPREAVEDAEFDLAEEVKGFLASQSFPGPIQQCTATSFRQSGQTEFPYGWVTFRLEVRT